ncbi:hypothetical protein ABW19_dt0206117 [Dactylella cylindrospora]|nr:hypothetical protein ABW19_dt0206117 [Dactylella cylindrospora]
MAWVPFDERFASLLESLAEHRQFLEHQITLSEYEAEDQARAAAEQERERAQKARDAALKAQTEMKAASIHARQLYEAERRETQITRVANWLKAPKTFVDRYEQAKQARLDDTGDWLFQTSEWSDWVGGAPGANVQKKDRDFLAVIAKPGAGKTVLAGTAIDSLIAARDDYENNSPSVLYFFYDYRYENQRAVKAALSAILCQAFSRGDTNDLLDTFLFLQERATGQSVASNNEIWELAQAILPRIPDATIVIDGFDECADTLDLIQKACVISTTGLAKVMLFGRPGESKIRSMLSQYPQLQMTAKHNSEDLGRYIEARSEEVFDLGIDTSVVVSVGDLNERLKLGANGMFLWMPWLWRSPNPMGA